MTHHPKGLVRKRSFRFLVFLTLILVISLYFLSMRGANNFFIDHILMNIAFPFQKAVTVAKDKVDIVFRHYLNLVETRKENDTLRKMVDNLRSKTVRLEELERENRRLRELLKFKQRIPIPMLPAEVIATSPTPWVDTFVVDKGTRDGVQQGMPVVNEKGVVGYILKTTRLVSTVMVLTHYNCRVDAIDQRTRSHGVVGGLLEGRCRLFNVLRNEDISEGDRVVTSGFGNRFPRGLLIGVIHKIKKRPFGLFQEAEIVPSVDFGKLEEVYVLLKPQIPIASKGKSHHE